MEQLSSGLNLQALVQAHLVAIAPAAPSVRFSEGYRTTKDLVWW